MNITSTDAKMLMKDTDVIRYMKHLGAVLYSNSDSEDFMVFTTICHGGNSPKLYYYKNSKTFHCYTECGQLDIFKLTEEVLGMDFKTAFDYVLGYFGIGKKMYYFGTPRHQQEETVEYSFDEVDVELEPISNPNIMSTFLNFYCPEWLQENISIETMIKYNIRYSIEQHRIIIPHVNAKGSIVGIRGRALRQEDVDRYGKYMPYADGKTMYNHSLRHNLYGLHFNQDAIKTYKRVIIVEGEKSVLQLDTMYPTGSPVVAVCGSNISKAQAKMLLDLGVEEVVFAFDKQFKVDGDEESIKWKSKIDKLSKHFIDSCKVSYIWDTQDLIKYKDSPTDDGKEVFETLLKCRHTINDIFLT